MTVINANALSNFVSLRCLSSLLNALLQNTMAEQNIPAQPPTRTDEQIVPRSQWLTIGKSNLLFNAQKIQKNPIFQISVDILKNTNFFQAFTASANVPAITANSSGKRCHITRRSGLGYPEPVEIVSNIRVNYVYQPWRAINMLLNQLLDRMSLAGQNPDTQFCKCCGESSLKLLLIMQTNMGEFTQRDPDNDYILGNLKFVPKGESVEVFRMAIPDPLITEAIQQSSYYPKYQKMLLSIQRKPLEKCKHATCTKRAYNPKALNHHTSKQKSSSSSLKGKLLSVSFHGKLERGSPLCGPCAKLIKLNKNLFPRRRPGYGDLKALLDPGLLPQGQDQLEGIDQDPVSETTPKLHEVVGKGKAVVTEEQVAHSLIDLSKKKRTTDQFILARRDQTPPDSTTGPSSQHDDDSSEKVIHESSSTSDSERTESDTEAAAPKGDKDQDEVGSRLQLRVARLEQEMSEVKKTDHSADVLASIRTQVPTAVDNYLGTKLDDALLKVLERHTADLIEKYSVLPGPESVKNQESERVPKVNDKVILEVFELKSALFVTVNKKKRMDKEVQTRLKTQESMIGDDDEDDDDDEGPSAGSNQGRSTKRRRSDSAASGSAKPPPKADDQSSKKPRESEASASKQHPSLSSTGWQITLTQVEAGVDFFDAKI
ncbi:hypothetical protein Tco_0512501 [Tanacetum coccineum]